MNEPASYCRDFSPAQVLSQCRWEAFRGSGPGGQKRNKTSSAVRVTHEPTGLTAVAGESRSQMENRNKALGRLRHRIALEIRRPLCIDPFEMPAWMPAIVFATAGQRIRLSRLSRRHAQYLDVVALVLDLIVIADGSVSVTALRLGTSSSDLVAFLQRDQKLLAQVNHIRRNMSLKPLGGRIG
jgi:hypothetical protein